MMNKPKPVFVKGKALTAAQLNALTDLVPRIVDGGGNTLLKRSGDQIIIDFVPQNKSAEPLMKAFIIVSVDDDFLLCKTLEDDDLRVPVAKPHLLQVTPFDGESIDWGEKTVSYSYTDDTTRTASSGGDSETQKVTPPYYVGEVIIGWRVYAQMAVTVGAISNVPVQWVDGNNGGRQWAVPEGD